MRRSPSGLEYFIAIVFIIALAFLLNMGIAWFLMWIWNTVIVSMFSAPAFTFWNMFFIVWGISIVGSFFKGVSTNNNK